MLLSTFLVTVLIDLNAVIQLGVVLSAFIFMKKMSDVQHIRIIAKEIDEDSRKIDQPHTIDNHRPAPPAA
ncbi:MAG TPA: hypothetical protein VJA84_02180 [Candidatus Omnitrophota bacterium]|nr:hypothetical protein [Candidatus Omnitrophota bacterium]